MFFAHSTGNADKGDWERLADHLYDVAGRAEYSGRTLGLAPLCRLAGLLHDLGKYNPAFQLRLMGAKQLVDHSSAGAAVVFRLVSERERIFAELVAYSIAGHHAGLPDKNGHSGGSLVERIAAFSEASLDPAWRTEIFAGTEPLKPAKDWRKESFGFQLAMIGRMIFSALVDADFKATEAFYARRHGREPDRNWPALRDLLDSMIASLDRHLARLSKRDSPVTRLRSGILEYVRGRANESPGLYTLTVPTGGGKTLTSLSFALDHARVHGKRRIIYAISFTSIIDQTASQFHALFGGGIVLEHHSALESQSTESASKADSEFANRDKLRLAMEDWAAPVVVTTNVQFFESLFASRTSSARKLHNIAESVIVLDEAQTLPRSLLLPILRTIEALARDYGCTVLLCTATQPAFDARYLKGGLALEGRELAPDPAKLAGALRRVTLQEAGIRTDAEIIDELREAPQGLVIVNSRKHALGLYRGAEASGLEGLIHLSTRMCAAHRRPLFDKIKMLIAAGEPCRVISTSLIEAGVDVDFPRV